VGHAGCIQWSRATDADLGELCKLRSLERLDLDGSEVTDAGLGTLSNLRGLQVLSLAETAITDKGLRHLESMSQLRFLELDGCPQITDAGVARLKTALPKCQIHR
jgi:internalin A